MANNSSSTVEIINSVVNSSTVEDIIAGTVLLVYGIVGLIISVIVAGAVFVLSTSMNGFKLIFSDSVANMLLLFQFGVWTGSTILFQTEFLSSYRLFVSIMGDFFWFSMAQHYPLIACSRFMAIKWPMKFKYIPAKYFLILCASSWCFALCQSVLLHLTSWYVLFHFDPVEYGMITDNFHDLSNGTAIFWRFYHSFMIITPLVIYGLTVAILFKQNRSVTPKQDDKKKQSRSLSVEKRLLIPCAINSLVYLLGKLSFDFSHDIIGGKWANWFYSFVYLTNSFLRPIILISFSDVVRNKTLEILRLKRPEGGSMAIGRSKHDSKISGVAASADRRRSSNISVALEKINNQSKM